MIRKFANAGPITVCLSSYTIEYLPIHNTTISFKNNSFIVSTYENFKYMYQQNLN